MVHGRSRRRRWTAPPAFAAHLRAVRYLAGGLVSGLAAIVVLAVVAAIAVLSLVGVGVLLAGVASMSVRLWADLDRARTGRYCGSRISSPAAAVASARPSAAWQHLAGGTFVRDLGALALRATTGVPFAALAVVLPLSSLSSAVIPLYWWALPEGEETGSLFVVASWWDALGSVAVGAAGLGIWSQIRWVAATDARLAARLLSPGRQQELRRRAEIERGRRDSAISAHTAELKRIERDLHDSTQNRMVAVALFVGMAQRQLATGRGDPVATLDRAARVADDALGELRRVVQGIYPPVLSEAGLVPAVGQLVDQNQIPTRLHVGRAAAAPAAVDAALYFSIAEALTNVARHSGATAAEVELRWEDREGASWVIATVSDDGRGSADPARGSGLAGIADRLEALGGRFAVTSPPGGPTTVRMEAPCAL